MRQAVQAGDQVFSLQKLAEVQFVRLQLFAIVMQGLALVRLQHFRGVGLAAEQQAGFLERLTHGRDAEAQGFLAQVRAAVGAFADNVTGVARIGAATGEDQRALGKVDLMMALYHEDFHAVRPIA